MVRAQVVLYGTWATRPTRPQVRDRKGLGGDGEEEGAFYACV